MANALTLSLTILLASTVALAQEQAEASPKLPAAGEAATDALTSSPRHGEYVDVPMGQTKIKTFVAYPERADDAPVVIVIHEIYGLTDWVRAVADQLAAEGYVAVAPDLLSGKGPNGGGTESFEGDAVRNAIRSLSVEEQTERLNAVRDWAIAHDATSEKVATIGFCWGGTASFNYAANQPKLNAAVVYYGTSPTEKAVVEKIDCPVLGLYGGNDARVTSTVVGTQKLMQDAAKPFTAHTYEGAGHGFLRQQSGQDGANQKAAQHAWAETLAFLKEHLQ